MEYQNQTAEKSPTPEVATQNGGAANGEAEKEVTEEEAASAEAADLVERLEYFKVGEEKVGGLKLLAIKLEVRIATNIRLAPLLCSSGVPHPPIHPALCQHAVQTPIPSSALGTRPVTHASTEIHQSNSCLPDEGTCSTAYQMCLWFSSTQTHSSIEGSLLTSILKEAMTPYDL